MKTGAWRVEPRGLMELIMKKLIYLLMAGSMALSPAMMLAKPGGGGGMGPGAAMGHGGGLNRAGAMGAGNTSGMGATGGLSSMGPTTVHTSQGPTNGAGWDHLHGPTHATGSRAWNARTACRRASVQRTRISIQ